MTDIPLPPQEAPAKGRKSRRALPESTKRILLIVGGVFILIASVAAFYFTSDAFDERSPVLVSSVPIEAGETVSATYFGSAMVLAESIPHIPYTADAPFAFDGMVAAQPIPASTLVRPDMFIEAGTVAVGVELELIVPLDLSLATVELADHDQVLLIDPGAAPTEEDFGRPRRVVRPFELTNFDGSQMRLLVTPEEWAAWTADLQRVGGTFMVVDLGLGADAQEMTGRLDAVWLDQWAEASDEMARRLAEANQTPTAGPGELEVIVAFDTSLTPSGVAEGDLVLVIDPGEEPLANNPGRPRSVIRTLELANYDEGQMQMFVPPEEWQYWLSLPEELGAAPMVLPVPEGTDTDDMSARLDTEWQTAWERLLTAAGSAG